MLVHAAFGGSTNLILHIPAIAAAAGLEPPSVDDWIRINRATPRLVDALPNGPRGFPTAQVFMAGGVPEVMLHLRRMGLLNGACSRPPARRSTPRSTGGREAIGGVRHARGSRRRQRSIPIT
jgi:dihydroxyacid dehydratase/phosphogluconate dehydratase